MSIEVVLASVAGKVAVDAIYYVTRLIRHRTGLCRSIPRLLVEGLANEPSQEAEALAKNIVQEIESETNEPFENLSAKSSSDVIGRLEQLMKQRYMEGSVIDTDRGDQLLKELRESSNL